MPPPPPPPPPPPSFFSSTVRSALRLVRRHPARIALLTALAGGAVAAAAYIRRQSQHLNATLITERRHGARALRAAYTAASQTLTTTFLVLLPPLSAHIAACASADASPALARLHERPTDRDEKAALWNSVRDASLTALLSAVYLAATLHTSLALQLHLLARYTAAALPDAPVQPLPGGPLRAPTSKRFLEVSSKHVAASPRAAAVVSAVAQRVRHAFADVSLAKPLPLATLHLMLLDVLRAVAHDERPSVDGAAHAAVATEPLFRRVVAASFVEETAEISTQAEEAPFEHEAFDQMLPGDQQNLAWLAREALDLSDVLAIDEVILAAASAAMAYSIGTVRQELAAAGADADTVPFAQMLGKLAAAANRVTEVADGANAVEMAMRGDDTCQHFAAAVFLSGEKQEGGTGGAFGGDIGTGSVPAVGVGVEGNGWHAGGMDGSAGGSGDNLGLMFDMANGEHEVS